MRLFHRRKSKNSFRRFMNLTVMVIAGSWIAYHGFSYFVLMSNQPAETQSQSIKDLNQPTLVKRIAPHQLEMLTAGPEEEGQMILLAGAQRPLATQPIFDKNNIRANTPIKLEIDLKVKEDKSKGKKILAKANSLVDDGKTIAARDLLNEYLADHFDDPASFPIRDRAIELGEQTLLSLKVYPGDTLASYYVIKPGDLLDPIARKCNVPYQFICRINKIKDPRRIWAGQKIKLVQGPVTLKVIKHEIAMYVFLQDVLFAKYSVSLGKNNKTPEGKWLVEDRIRKPLYKDPDTGEVYAPDDPNNPTGGYWLRLKGVEGQAVGKTGFGIHGTNEPDSIGKFMSKGCVRMRNEEMAEVFDMLTPGLTEVYTLP
jgi:LysM repeat protein